MKKTGWKKLFHFSFCDEHFWNKTRIEINSKKPTSFDVIEIIISWMSETYHGWKPKMNKIMSLVGLISRCEKCRKLHF